MGKKPVSFSKGKTVSQQSFETEQIDLQTSSVNIHTPWKTVIRSSVHQGLSIRCMRDTALGAGDRPMKRPYFQLPG